MLIGLRWIKQSTMDLGADAVDRPPVAIVAARSGCQQSESGVQLALRSIAFGAGESDVLHRTARI
jgi:hypothetical protein